MIIRSAQFITSNQSVEKCPPPIYPEYAFCGRSNVGKSSLINMLVGMKSLAKTSGTPGKTQLINHFVINENMYFADLPGYGFARAPKDLKDEWVKMTQDFLVKRSNLMCLFALIDSRLDPQAIDLEFINFLGKNSIPFAIVFTKSDKVSKKILSENLEKFNMAMLKTWEALPDIFVTSSEKRLGREEIFSFIKKTNPSFVYDKKNTH